VAIKKISRDGVDQKDYEDYVSRLSMEAVLLRRAAGPHIASFLGLLRIDDELNLAL
jgi:hypothetical protein